MLSRRRLPLVAAVALASAACVASAPLAVSATTPEGTSPTSPTTPENPAPPKVTTDSATTVYRTGATLNGSVIPGGTDTTYHFEYGTSTSYGLSTPETPAGAGTAAVPVEKAISGLTVNTTYHYRLVATNAAGVVRGNDKTVKTQSNPNKPWVGSQATTAVTATGATLTARLNPAGQATTYYFQYGTSAKYGGKTGTASAGSGTATITVSAPITGLKPNTKYSFRIVAANPTGTVRGPNRTFTTPRGLTGVNISAPKRTVLWNTNAIVNGTVAGLSTGGVKVALMRQDAPFTAPFRQVATQTTSSAGAYSFSVGPLWWGARFQVTTATTPPLSSSVLEVKSRLLARLRVSRKRATNVRLRGQIYPAVPNAQVSVQRKTPKGRWVRVARPTLVQDTAKNRTTYGVTVSRLADRTARYRVRIAPNDAGAHVTTTSKSVAVARRR